MNTMIISGSPGGHVNIHCDNKDFYMTINNDYISWHKLVSMQFLKNKEEFYFICGIHGLELKELHVYRGQKI